MRDSESSKIKKPTELFKSVIYHIRAFEKKEFAQSTQNKSISKKYIKQGPRICWWIREQVVTQALPILDKIERHLTLLHLSSISI